MSMEQLLNQEEQKAADEFATKNVVTAIEGGKFDSINLQTGLSSEGKVFEELRVENEGAIGDGVIENVYGKLGKKEETTFTTKEETIDGVKATTSYFETSTPDIIVVEINPTDEELEDKPNLKSRRTVFSKPGMSESLC